MIEKKSNFYIINLETVDLKNIDVIRTLEDSTQNYPIEIVFIADKKPIRTIKDNIMKIIQYKLDRIE